MSSCTIDDNGHEPMTWEIKGGATRSFCGVVQGIASQHAVLHCYTDHTVVGLGYDRSHMLHIYSGHLD